MTRLMHDSTSAQDIPEGGQLVGGYVDGRYAWTADDWARFPDRVQVRIACLPTTNDGTVQDCEAGNGTPWQMPSWVLMRRAAGVDPTIYCNLGTWPLVRQAFMQQRVTEPHYWIARWDGVQDIPEGAVAVQYANSDMTGGHYDESAVQDTWPGVDVPAPGPSGVEVDDMVILQAANQPWLFVCGGIAVPIPSQADAQALEAAGARVAPVSDQLYAAVYSAAQALARQTQGAGA